MSAKAIKEQSKPIAEHQHLSDLISRLPFFKDLNAQHLQLLAALAMEIQFDAGQFVVRRGDPANRFYVILDGQVELRLTAKDGRAIAVHSLGPGDGLGWSWLIPPYFFRFNAYVVKPTKAIFFYGTILRERCDEDHEFGYEIMKRVAKTAAENFGSLEQDLQQRTNL